MFLALADIALLCWAQGIIKDRTLAACCSGGIPHQSELVYITHMGLCVRRESTKDCLLYSHCSFNE